MEWDLSQYFEHVSYLIVIAECISFVTGSLGLWDAGSSGRPILKFSMSPAASVSVLIVVEAGVAPS